MSERLARVVGGITLGLLAGAIVFAMFFYASCAQGDRIRIRVYFHGAGGLQEGAPLVVGGREVGEVEAIARAPEGELGTPLAGDEGIVMTVGIERRTAVLMRRGGDVFVAAKGPLGSRYLEVGAAPADGPIYRDGDQVLGRDPPELDRAVQRTWDNLQVAKAFADELRPEAHALAAQLRLLADTAETVMPPGQSMDALRGELLGLLAEAERAKDVGLGGDAGLARIGAVATHARAVIAQARTALDRLRANADALSGALDAAKARTAGKGDQTMAAIDRAIAGARAAIDKIDPLLAQVQALNDRLARGEGSLGRLMKDPEFPEDAKELGKILKRQPWRIFAHPPD